MGETGGSWVRGRGVADVPGPQDHSGGWTLERNHAKRPRFGLDNNAGGGRTEVCKGRCLSSRPVAPLTCSTGGGSSTPTSYLRLNRGRERLKHGQGGRCLSSRGSPRPVPRPQTWDRHRHRPLRTLFGPSTMCHFALRSVGCLSRNLLEVDLMSAECL